MTSSAIDLRVLPNNIPSLCVPRVFSNIDEKRIRRIFGELNMGEIERVDIISKTTEKGDKFNRVFIHFKNWFRNVNADMARERLLNGKEIKIIYDEPWFWKVSAYREAAASSRPSKPRPQEKKKATLQFDSDSEDNKPLNHAFRQTTKFGRDKRPPTQKPQVVSRPKVVTTSIPISVPELKRNIAETFVPSPSSSPEKLLELGRDLLPC